MPRRLRLLPVLVVVLACAASSASAAAPKRDRDYHGVIRQHAGGHVFTYRVSFHVSKDRRTAEHVRLPDGMPLSDRCAMGPWGTPEPESARIAHHRFSVREKLDIPPPDDTPSNQLGYVVVAGHFRSHGRFSGTVDSHVKAEICRTTMRFTARASRR